ncbi:hypothetical protein RRG08_029219 [Elysia crispata]|uniref:Uncharacterized protein n=1 Tax=Elysia crispata TaxID=231223 RepID=A0AAE1AJS9_9GAST|nr:hypothetical protein RRG08_029219 [Elysia crispata]
MNSHASVMNVRPAVVDATITRLIAILTTSPTALARGRMADSTTLGYHTRLQELFSHPRRASRATNIPCYSRFPSASELSIVRCDLQWSGPACKWSSLELTALGMILIFRPAEACQRCGTALVNQPVKSRQARRSWRRSQSDCLLYAQIYSKTARPTDRGSERSSFVEESPAVQGPARVVRAVVPHLLPSVSDVHGRVVHTAADRRAEIFTAQGPQSSSLRSKQFKIKNIGTAQAKVPLEILEWHPLTSSRGQIGVLLHTVSKQPDKVDQIRRASHFAAPVLDQTYKL